MANIKNILYYSATAYSVVVCATTLIGLFTGRNPSVAWQTLKAGSGLAPVVATFGATKNTIAAPNKAFYVPQGDPLPLNKPSEALAGMTPQQHATLLYATLYTAPVTENGARVRMTSENWDNTARLDDISFQRAVFPVLADSRARFEVLERMDSPEEEGFAIVAYNDKRSGNMHVFMIPQKEKNPWANSVFNDKRPQQIESLRQFVTRLKKNYPNNPIASLTAHSIATIPASLIAFEQNLRYIAVEPRMNRDLAASLTKDHTNFLAWYSNTVTTLEVGGNAWNRMRVTTLGEAPPVNGKRSLVITENNVPMMGTPILDLWAVSGPHQAQGSVRALAIGQTAVGLTAVAPESLPRDAAEVLQARNIAERMTVGLFGAAALAATATTSTAVIQALFRSRNTQTR